MFDLSRWRANPVMLMWSYELLRAVAPFPPEGWQLALMELARFPLRGWNLTLLTVLLLVVVSRSMIDHRIKNHVRMPFQF